MASLRVIDGGKAKARVPEQALGGRNRSFRKYDVLETLNDDKGDMVVRILGRESSSVTNLGRDVGQELSTGEIIALLNGPMTKALRYDLGMKLVREFVGDSDWKGLMLVARKGGFFLSVIDKMMVGAPRAVNVPPEVKRVAGMLGIPLARKVFEEAVETGDYDKAKEVIEDDWKYYALPKRYRILWGLELVEAISGMIRQMPPKHPKGKVARTALQTMAESQSLHRTVGEMARNNLVALSVGGVTYETQALQK